MIRLTERERQIASLITSGKSYKRIAAMLEIEVDTVKEHVQNAGRKLPGRFAPKMKLVIFTLEEMRQKA